MQQHPVRSSLRRPSSVVSRLSRAAVALCAVVTTLPFAGHEFAGTTARPRTTDATRADAVHASYGTVAARLTPALPRALRPVVASPTTELPPLAASPRQRLELGAPGTYIDELLRSHDSANLRWPDRVDHPLTVWVADASGLPDWHAAYVGRVAEAFAEWAQTGVPVRFRFVSDSSAAEVHVAWTDRFRQPYSGITVWSRDEHWWMNGANITLALHHNDGRALDEDQVHAIALHEIGHLLGLDHTTDPSNVMAARVRVRDISVADQATARLVYSLPAGHL